MGLLRTFCTALALSLAGASILDPATYSPENVITRDVVIIGGGSSGTYTAFRLRDFKKSVIVVEEQNRLGGHAETYIDPATGTSFNLGVVVFDQLTEVKNYFARFNVPLKNDTSSSIPQWTDFATGKSVSFAPPSQQEFVSALEAYAKIVAKYPKLQDGFYLDYPVAEDLLLPFGDFLEKYSLGPLLPTIFLTCQGYSPLLKISTIYMFKYLNLNLVNSFKTSYLTTVHNNTGELYDKAAKALGHDALLSSSVLTMDRTCSSGPVKVVVQTPSGRKLIVAKKLVSTIPPKIHNLHGFDLSPNETSVFSQFFNNAYYTSILNNTGLPAGTDLTNPGPMVSNQSAPQPASQSAQKNQPGIYAVGGSSIVADLFQVFYGLPRTAPEKQVKADIIASVQRVQKTRGIHTTSPPEFTVFKEHAPFNLMVSNEAIKDRFYEKALALQGQRNTFYNGAWLQTQSSSTLWQTTEALIPKIVAAL